MKIKIYTVLLLTVLFLTATAGLGTLRCYADEPEEITFVGSIKNGDENLYIVDLGSCRPDVDIWEYSEVTDFYLGNECTFYTDNEGKIRALVMMGEEGDFSLYAYESGTPSFYRIETINDESGKYYVVSAKAVSGDESGRGDSNIYAIKSDGSGGFYIYGETTAAEEDESAGGMSSLKRVVTALLIIGAVYLCLISLRRLIKKDTRLRIALKLKKVKEGLGRENLRQYAFVLRQLSAREIKRKYARSRLGIIWSVLNPLINMTVMTMIFSYMFKHSIQNFPLYYLTGNIFWTLFSQSTNSAMGSLVDNKALLMRTKLSQKTFVVSRMVTSLVNFGYSCLPYAFMLLIFGIEPGWRMLLFIPDVLLLSLFAMGIGYLLSILYVFFADIQYLYGVLLTVLMYMTAVFYPVTSLPENVKNVVNYNPVYMSIYIARECMVYGRTPDVSAWIKLGISALISLIIGSAIFKKYRNRVMAQL